MTQHRSIGYHDPRSSSEINERRINFWSGATNGYNVRAIGGTTEVRVSNVDLPGTWNTLTTPEGVVIHEDVDQVADIDVGAPAFSGYIVCRYKHPAAIPDPAATYLAVTFAQYQSDRDTILARVEKGVGFVTDTEIREMVRRRAAGMQLPLSSIYGIEGVRSVQPLALGGWSANMAAAAWAANASNIWLSGVATELHADIFIPAYHLTDVKSFADLTTTTDLWVKLWLSAAAPIAAGRTVVVDGDFYAIADGGTYDPAVPTQTYQDTVNMTGKVPGDIVSVEFSIVAPSVDTLYHLRFRRRGDLITDDWIGIAEVRGAIMYYARNRIGGLYV